MPKRSRDTSITSKPLPPEVREFLSTIGRTGGKRSRRSLSSSQAREMLKVREARRAFKRYQALCFWSYDPALQITKNEVAWVAEMLMKHGNRQALEVAERLCR